MVVEKNFGFLLVLLEFSSSCHLFAWMKSAAMLGGAQWRGPWGKKLREASSKKPMQNTSTQWLAGLSLVDQSMKSRFYFMSSGKPLRILFLK